MSNPSKQRQTAWRSPGVLAALAAALLFGAGTPLAKLLLGTVSPWMLAGLLYLGSGIGLWLYRTTTRQPQVSLVRGEWRWLSAAIAAGGIIGPVLLMMGLSAMPASSASLLLNAEGVFTALIAWFVFHENVDARIALGMLAIVAGAAVLSWPRDMNLAALWPALAILAACLAWALDNNLTRKLSLHDASWLASVKGLVAGATNLLIAAALGQSLPGLPLTGMAMLLGLCAYGISLTLFVLALRHLGTARASAYFSIAPFFGALLAVALGEPATRMLLFAGALMALGTWLHLAEHHEHEHRHDALEHDHEHVHGQDEHHQHEHDEAPTTPHRHRHTHAPLVHRHAHYPEAHHQHRH